MSKTTKRGIIQFAFLAAALIIGYVAAGWVGALIGFGVFVVGIFVTAALLLKRLSKAEAEEQAAEQAAEEAITPEPNVVYVKAPQDHKKKTRR